VPGHYAPNPGGGLVWAPGFWADAQPGWDWVPARWVRRAGGWEFRRGYWVPDRSVAAAPAPGAVGTTRRTVARPPITDDPNHTGLPPAILDSEPAPQPPNTASTPTDLDPNARAAALDPDAPLADRSDPIAAREALADRPVYVVPAPALGYIAPAYPYPYGYYTTPRGAVMFNPYVPPFVKRILNRVLP
jgi:hypothetical protein